MYHRRALKREAKRRLHGSAPHFMLVALVYVLLTTGLSELVYWLAGDSGIVGGVLGLFLNTLVWLFTLVLGVGFSNYALRLARQEENGFGSLFAPFSYAGASIGLSLLVGIFSFLWSLLAAVVFGVLLALVLIVLGEILPLAVALSVILYIAAMVAVAVIVLRYAMAEFALADDPNAGVMEAIRRSVRMMRKHKGRYFVLHLSFLGWDALVAAICAAGALVGVLAAGMDWVTGLYGALEGIQADPWAAYSAVETAASRLFLWVLLARVVSLPLTLWLQTYRMTACARFYNYVSGYDYHVYMTSRHSLDEPEGEPRLAQPPAGGYYTPQPPPAPPEAPEPPDGGEESENRKPS